MDNSFKQGDKREASAGETQYLQEHGFGSPERPARMKYGGESTTLFVNLSANLNLFNGALREDKALQDEQLLKMTVSKPVKIIVQTSANFDAALNKTDPDSRIVTDSDQKHTAIIRYEIVNGRKRLLGTYASNGPAEDLKGLLSADPKALKARRVVLINQSHGNGIDDLLSDAGRWSPVQLKDTVSAALKSAGRNSLDLLDLVACEMANIQAFEVLSPISKYIVASETPEFSSQNGHHNMQPIAASIMSILRDRDQAPQAMARKIEQISSQACREDTFKPDVSPKDFVCATNTLGFYDAMAFTKLSPALNELGGALLKILHQDNNDRILSGLISALPRVYVGEAVHGSFESHRSYENQHRDLGAFVGRLRERLINGDLHDTEDRQVSMSLDNLEAAMKRTVLSHFNGIDLNGEVRKGLEAWHLADERLSGLSILLPTANSRLADTLSPIIKNTWTDKILWNVSAVNGALSGDSFSDKARDFKRILQNDAQDFQELSQSLPGPSQQIVQRFTGTAQKFADWLGSAETMDAAQRQREFDAQDSELRAAVKAVGDDMLAFQAGGTRLAAQLDRRPLRKDFLPPQAKWNEFLEAEMKL